jgi:hypothetical protein
MYRKEGERKTQGNLSKSIKVIKGKRKSDDF